MTWSGDPGEVTPEPEPESGLPHHYDYVPFINDMIAAQVAVEIETAGTPGLPNPHRPRPDVVMCIYCLVGGATGHGPNRHKCPAITFWQGTAMCEHCAKEIFR